MATEIVARRQLNSKTFDLGGGLRRLDAHVGHIHYEDGQGALQDCDYALVDRGSYWELAKASYRLRIAKAFGAPALLQFTNRYKGASHSITYEPHSLWWVNAANPSQRQQFRAAQAVTGAYDPTTQTIRWTNAFGAGVDFEVVVQRSGFKKQIVARAAPPAAPYGNAWLVFVSKWDAQNLTVRSDAGQDWDGLGYLEADEFTVEENADRRRRSFIRSAWAIDGLDRRVQLRVMFERRGGALWQGKIIPDALLRQAVYPVYADTTTSYYAGAGDGRVTSGGASTTWDTAHDATDGASASATATTCFSGAFCNDVTGYREIYRAFFPTDTSGLPDNAIISAATLNLYVTVNSNQDNDGDDWMNVVQTSQASSSTLAVGDFDQCGAVNNPTEGATRIDLGSVSTSAYTAWTLDATGRGWISKTGFTLLGMREGHDAIDSPIDGSGGATQNRLTFSTSEETGTSQDPYLSVTYTVPGGLMLMGVG